MQIFHQTQEGKSFEDPAHLAVADAVDHLVEFTVEGVCQEAQALQHSTDVIDWFTAGNS